MKNIFMADEVLATMEQEKGKLCVSVIVPTHSIQPAKRTDQLEIEKAIQTAKEQLTDQYSIDQVTPLLQAMDELYRQIDYTHPKEGIGLYVSDAVQKLVYFDFPVQEKIIISPSFEIRDWVYQTYYDTPYFILLLSENEIKLFRAQLDSITEVMDGHFPKMYTEAYEYNPPTRGSSYTGHAFTKDFEKDKSELEAVHIQKFFRSADGSLPNYLNDQSLLVIAGAYKDLAYYDEITRHEKNIACHIPGNYFFTALDELSRMTWMAVQLFLDKKKDQLLNEFREKIGARLGIEGITAVWKAVNEGRGHTLLVEKDYAIPGFIKEDGYLLYLQPPGEPCHTLPDAVEALIELVIEKKGRVVMVDNDKLRAYDRIALIARY